MTSVQTLRVKGTADQLPAGAHGKNHKSSPLWEAVAAECRAHTGTWVMFEIPGRNKKNLESSRTHINAGKYVAFRSGEYEAAVRGTVLYVRHLGEPAPVSELDQKRREVA